jgi:predicted porin
MKKTLVALSVLAAASAQAGIELYNQDGVTVALGGDVEVVYVKDKAKGSEAEQQIQDADISLDVRYAINDALQFGGFWQINDVGVDKDAANDGDAYVAFYSDDYGSIKFGRTCANLDDAGIGSDFQFGLSTFFGGDDSHFCADETIRYDLDKGAFYGGFALVQDKNGDEGLNDDSTYFDGKLGYRVADFDFTAFYGAGEVGEGAAAHDEKLWSAQARYNGVENLELAAAYYNIDDSDVSIDTIGLAATYTIEKVVFAGGYSTSKSDASGSDSFNAWYVNAGYKLAPNTTAYAEVGGDNGENDQGESNETGVAVGIKAYF